MTPDQEHAIRNPHAYISSNSVDDLKKLFPDIHVIPSLNEFPDLPCGSLIRWDCFVQDTAISFEVFPISAKVRNIETGEEKSMRMAYSDGPRFPWEILPQDFGGAQFSEKVLRLVIFSNRMFASVSLGNQHGALQDFRTLLIYRFKQMNHFQSILNQSAQINQA